VVVVVVSAIVVCRNSPPASDILERELLVSHCIEGFRGIVPAALVQKEAGPSERLTLSVFNKLQCTRRMEGLTDGLSFVLILACQSCVLPTEEARDMQASSINHTLPV
jgi:hypothetical protein